MEQRRISMSDITLGQPLQWDVTDASGNLLLKRGQVIQREQQIDTLISRGMFIDGDRNGGGSKAPAAATLREPPSILRMINLAEKRLERLQFNLGNEPDIQGKFLEVANALQFATTLNRDIAMATILLNQDSGHYPVRHCVDTAIVSILIARGMGKSKEETTVIAAAALTMNLGMLREQEQFQARQEPLAEPDRQAIHAHPEQTVKLLRDVGVTNQDWLNYILLHHENENGSGYPFGKTGAEMPDNAKIIAIADRYCARVSDRNYRKPMLPNAALRDILIVDKENIDQRMAKSLINELGVYPCGTFVRLENGEVGVVTAKGSTTTAPIVHALLGPRGAPLSFPIKRDSSKSLLAIREVIHAENAAVRFSMQQLWGSEAIL
ncbi:HD-GYP domain-containing protein (c-di-GMP phosphodiesterase class II) [Actimicrobium sp. GrIS 1.19]|uniref:HD-GYP domain-containing protein n=1 Tax=Actimicrobium sp. GrIS 1.19 TaxID=3071708 RepID=UPI002DFBF20C|nr:HD-GYP domain-containing protein (c-di-GMP phosphodiesterase class II) [Actimicrobium sp. GrIS 1.19]